MTLDRFHYLPSMSCNALKAVSNRIFDAHLTYNWCHFISLRWMLLFTTIVSLEPSCSSLLLLSTRMAFLCLCLFVDVNPTFLSLSLFPLNFSNILSSYSRLILAWYYLLLVFFPTFRCFPPKFHRGLYKQGKNRECNFTNASLLAWLTSTTRAIKRVA